MIIIITTTIAAMQLKRCRSNALSGSLAHTGQGATILPLLQVVRPQIGQL